MGLRFRKSLNLGPVRINVSKSGIGASAGSKGFRVTKKAGGGTRTTASIPGTGVSYVKETGGSELDTPPKSFKGLYILAAIFVCLFAVLFIIFSQTRKNNEESGLNEPLASSSVSSSEDASGNEQLIETVRSLADDLFPSDSVSNVRVSDAQAEIFIKNSATSLDFGEMELTAQQASTLIQDSLAPRNAVVYIQDDAGNNLLTIINGKTTYNAGADNTASGQNQPTITLEEFNAIQEGMTYQEVTDIVGSSGELISETDIGVPEYYTQMRSWDGEGELGANANVIFQGGVVTSKSQFGLS